MKFKQVTWDTYESKWCIRDRTEVCYKAECHESTGVKCCLACKRCNAWRSCPKERINGIRKAND